MNGFPFEYNLCGPGQHPARSSAPTREPRPLRNVALSSHRSFSSSSKLAMKWLDFEPSRQAHAAELLSHVRFETIPASELVSQIQPVPRMMMDPQCHRLLVDAMNYHLLPYQQNTLQSRRTQVRGGQQTLLTIGGRPSLTERALSREVSPFFSSLSSTDK